ERAKARRAVTGKDCRARPLPETNRRSHRSSRLCVVVGKQSAKEKVGNKFRRKGSRRQRAWQRSTIPDRCDKEMVQRCRTDRSTCREESGTERTEWRAPIQNKRRRHRHDAP